MDENPKNNISSLFTSTYINIAYFEFGGVNTHPEKDR